MKNLRAGLPEPERRKQRVNGRSPMSDDQSTVYDLQKFRFIFHFSDSEIKRERKREKYLEGGPEGALEQRSISDLR